MRYVLNWRDPRTGSREQRFFERQKDAQEKRAELVAAYERGTYSAACKTVTVADAVAAWLDGKRGVVRPNTFASYEFQARYVTGPLLPAEAREAIVRSGTGAKPNARPLELLGHVKAQELTTRHIRAWHKQITEEVSVYSANRALAILRAALALAAEDHEFRPPAMPTGLQRRRDKARKAVLTPEQVAALVAAARIDHDKGGYVAFPFLAGTRPSEQLGLLWDNVDFDANLIHIRRIQLKDGALAEVTKTAAGARVDSDVAVAARDVARLAAALPAQGRGAASGVPGARQAPRLAAAARERRRGAALQQLPRPRLGSDAEAPRPAAGDAALGAPFLHLDAASGGRGSRARGEARRPQERGGDAVALHPRHARRRRCCAGA